MLILRKILQLNGLLDWSASLGHADWFRRSVVEDWSWLRLAGSDGGGIVGAGLLPDLMGGLIPAEFALRTSGDSAIGR